MNINQNPIQVAAEAKEATWLEVAKGAHLPIHICCVLDEYADFKDPILHMVRDHCQKSNVLFTSRTYDSDKHSCDRYFIERLPAFHIYMKKSYMKTYYTNTRPLQNIDDAVILYKKRIEAAERKKQIWRNKFLAVLNWFKKLGHRKTRMEQYVESIEGQRQSKSTDW